MEFRYTMCRAPWPGRPAEAYHRKVERLPRASLERIGQALFGVPEADQVRAELHIAIDEVLMVERPDTKRLVVRDREFILTGGLAEEGDPTEAFGWVQLLWASGITLVRKPDIGHAARDALENELQVGPQPQVPDRAEEVVVLAAQEIAEDVENGVEQFQEDLLQLVNMINGQLQGAGLGPIGEAIPGLDQDPFDRRVEPEHEAEVEVAEGDQLIGAVAADGGENDD